MHCNGGGGYSLLFLSRDNREWVELSATAYSTIPLLSGTTFWLTVERSCTHVLTAIHHLSTSLFYTSPGGPVLEINYSGYHGRGPKAFLYFWKPRLTRKRKLGRLKHCFVPAKYIVLSPQIPFMVLPHFIKSKMFQICKRPKKHFIKSKMFEYCRSCQEAAIQNTPCYSPCLTSTYTPLFLPKTFWYNVLNVQPISKFKEIRLQSPNV